GNRHILVKEILPNLITPIIVYSTLLIPTNILFEAALSFLGVGINPPTPSWGKMLSEAIPTYGTAPYFVIIPGLAIFVTVLAFNLCGDGLRDAFGRKTSDLSWFMRWTAGPFPARTRINPPDSHHCHTRFREVSPVRKRLFGFVALGAASSLFLAACGGGG